VRTLQEIKDFFNNHVVHKMADSTLWDIIKILMSEIEELKEKVGGRP